MEILELTFAEFSSTVEPLVLFVLGMVVYSVFIFKFYKFVAKRDFPKLELHKYSKGFKGVVQKIAYNLFYMVETIFVTPLLVFFWFVVLGALLLIISKTPTDTLFLISAALVASIRITSYYDENLSQDVAKMVPFALLGVFITDLSFFSLDKVFEVIKAVPAMWKVLIYYLLLIILIEAVLRILETIIKIFSKKSNLIQGLHPGM